MPRETRNVCFVTGTRAEFGLMQPVLRAIVKEKSLRLQLVATGMHLDPSHGDGIAAIESAGWKIDRVVPWAAGSGRDRQTNAHNTGLATAALAGVYPALRSDVVIVVGDRVEAFAAAAAAHLVGVPVAHVHGGDRAAGQTDDSLRHAITKLAHVHFPATRRSAHRLHQLGEDGWRIRLVGSPGVDGITAEAAGRRVAREAAGLPKGGRFALLVLHPVDADDAAESSRAAGVLRSALAAPFDRIVVIYPNNDPGSKGIIRCWKTVDDPRCRFLPDVRRAVYLGLLRDADVLIGNSSSGIIEAASFGTPVIDVGPRQAGRERGPNVRNVSYDERAIHKAVLRIWNGGRPRRFASDNIYGGAGAGKKIARVLSALTVDDRLLRKLIRY